MCDISATNAASVAPLIQTPTAAPLDSADAALIPVAKMWLNESALGEVVHEFKMRTALLAWLTAKGALD